MTAAPTPFPADWLAAFTVDELERLAIRTVDGGLTDHEALKDEGLVNGGALGP